MKNIVKKLALTICAVVASTAFTGAITTLDGKATGDSPVAASAEKKQGAFVNCDGDQWNSFFIWADINGKTIDDSNYKALFREYIEGYCKGGDGEEFQPGDVSDLVLNCFCQNSLTPTDVFSFRADKKDWTTEGGHPVDYSNHAYICNIDRLYSFGGGFDPTEEAYAILREYGVNPWMGFRLNDNHESLDTTSYLRSEFYYEAKANGWLMEEVGCYDFSVPEVRQKYLDYIEEQIFRYDAYGVEWDWQRNVHTIPTWRGGDLQYYVDCMNDFTKRAYEVVQRAEEKWGHEIKINIRMHGYLDEAYQMGFDVATWAKNGWMTSMTAAPYAAFDSEIPITEWVDLLHTYGIEVYGGIDPLYTPGDTIEQYKGIAASFYEQGADAFYFHNLFHLDLQNFDSAAVGGLKTPAQMREIWHACSTPELASSGDRLYYITGQEKAIYLSLYFGSYPADPFPLKGKNLAYTFHTGAMHEDEEAYVYLSAKAPVDLYVGDTKLEYVGEFIEPIVSGGSTYLYSIPYMEGITTYDIRFDGGCTLYDIRIRVFEEEQDFTDKLVDPNAPPAEETKLEWFSDTSLCELVEEYEGKTTDLENGKLLFRLIGNGNITAEAQAYLQSLGYNGYSMEYFMPSAGNFYAELGGVHPARANSSAGNWTRIQINRGFVGNDRAFLEPAENKNLSTLSAINWRLGYVTPAVNVPAPAEVYIYVELTKDNFFWFERTQTEVLSEWNGKTTSEKDGRFILKLTVGDAMDMMTEQAMNYLMSVGDYTKFSVSYYLPESEAGRGIYAQLNEGYISWDVAQNNVIGAWTEMQYMYNFRSALTVGVLNGMSLNGIYDPTWKAGLTWRFGYGGAISGYEPYRCSVVYLCFELS